jgi:hypothetical protein
MASIGENNKRSVIKIVQELLQYEVDKSAITPTLIAEKIKLALMLHPKWGDELDHNTVKDELIRRFSIWIGQDTSLVNNVGHIPWLKSERKQDWRYWQRYREWQEFKLPPDAIEGLDASSDRILELLEDPLREGPWDRRGLVVGHVQSGKTGNYTGLICKAADAGYKIIIVLAGMHNNLRSQTQMRLDEGFLGYETSPIPDDIKIIGVGTIDGDPAIRPNYATNRSEKGDFSTKIAKSLGVSPEQRPWLFVVKKNKTVLERLYKWINNHVANTVDAASGRKIVTHLPLLVIDDEADNASVDTGEQLFTEEGKPDEEHQPTAINSLIRKILHSFQRKAYVGYTATPFANIFIHERGATPSEGDDLFPSSFIINLAAPSNYVGPARVFGLSANDQRQSALPLIRKINDHCSDDGKSGWIPPKHKSSHKPTHPSANDMPDSLAEAIDAFVIACAIRHLRGQNDQHSSMLVHVTRFNAVQKDVYAQVEAYIRHMKQRLYRAIGHEEILERLEALWLKDFLPTTTAMHKELPELAESSSLLWEQIREVFLLVVSEISVRMINGTAKDALDYADSAGGLKVIAIGGDKLARGLTLEGLCVSYFLRASRMYDTLMQMGRWFGYRPGYLDLCRLYTTDDLVEWFGHIADASEELREEFDIMAASGGTPREYGLKVQSHPVLLVTSRLKMRSAKSLFLSFSGSFRETTKFFRDLNCLNSNIEALAQLIDVMGLAREIPKYEHRKNLAKGAYWENVSYQYVLEFLENYKVHPKSINIDSKILKDFIGSMVRIGELTSWTVAIIGGSVDNKPPLEISEGFSVNRVERNASTQTDDSYDISRLSQPMHEGIGLDETDLDAAFVETKSIWYADQGRLKSKDEPPTIPSRMSMRRVRDPKCGLLLIYVLEPLPAIETNSSEYAPPVVAFGISFPGSNNARTVEYKVNNVLWEQEYGDAE